MPSRLRWVPLLLLVVLLDVALSAEGLLRGAGPPPWRRAADADVVPRFVVLGFDGVDPRILREYLDAGELPEIAALVKSHGLHHLRSEIPPESPVAWAALLTGVNPGRTRITDFVIRETDKTGYKPVNGMVDLVPPRFLWGKVPVRPPLARSRLAYPTFLERVAGAGYDVLALREPLVFPAPQIPGARTLSGLGTPDIAGANGLYALYGTDLHLATEYTVFDGHRIALSAAPGGAAFSTYLEGPFDPTGREADGSKRRITVPMRFERATREGPVTIEVDGRRETAAVGERTPWMRVAFPIPSWPPRRLHGLVRFEVQSADPLRVLADPVQIDPEDAPVPLSSPPEWSADLARRYGPYKTTGWMEQTFQLNDRSTTEAGFLKDLLEDMEHGEAVLLGELRRGGRCVFSLFTQTDRASHCFFWRRDPKHPARGHPLFDANAVARLPDPLLDVYRRMDRIVGDVRRRLDPGDALLVVSDHGFQSWRRGMNVNQWLMNEGYLVTTSDPGEKTLGDFFADRNRITVDWSKTKAYALGLGQIFLNRVGREPEGIVTDAEAPALLDAIEKGLLAYADVDGVRPLRRVYRLHDLYSGPYVHECGELQLGFAEGYRVSWQTALLAGMREDGAVCEDNAYPWSGDHCSTDRDLVPGVLLCNLALPAASDAAPYQVRDVAATALRWFRLAHEDVEGRDLPLPYPAPAPAPVPGTAR